MTTLRWGAARCGIVVDVPRATRRDSRPLRAGLPARRRDPRPLPFGIPPRGWLLSGWSLLPLRAFLALVFLYAGLQKLANPAFLSTTAAGGIHSQMVGYIRTSPIHLLLGHLLRFSTPIGVAMAIGELAVGLGMALGLWTRIAALGGMAISFSLFLTVSFHSAPWYTGADLLYFFAFMPFVVAGAGGVLSLDARIARRAALDARVDDPVMVVLPFAEAQQSCGSYDSGRCKAIPNRLCAPAGCPFLEGIRMSLPAGRAPDEVDRRAVVIGGVTAAVAAGAGIVLAGAVAGAGRAIGGVKVTGQTQGSFPTTTTTPAGGSTTTAPSSLGTALGPASSLPVGQSASFTVPSNGDPGIVIQPTSGKFVAYDAVCPHAGCTVGWYQANNVIACPCHGSEFDPNTGAVIVGPAAVGLQPVTVTEGPNGVLYVK